MQKFIQQKQDEYVRLLALMPMLDNHLAQWQEAISLINSLTDFYDSPQWLECYDNADKFALNTHAHHSVLSQDAIWNVLAEQREIAENLLILLQTYLKQDEN